MARKDASKFFDEGLRLISFCPLCEAHFSPKDSQIIGERENSHLLHITCQKCRNSVLAIITVSSEGISSVGLVTDLNYEDVLKFRQKQAVETDDVLLAHAALEDSDRFWKGMRQ